MKSYLVAYLVGPALAILAFALIGIGRWIGRWDDWPRRRR